MCLVPGQQYLNTSACLVPGQQYLNTSACLVPGQQYRTWATISEYLSVTKSGWSNPTLGGFNFRTMAILILTKPNKQVYSDGFITALIGRTVVIYCYNVVLSSTLAASIGKAVYGFQP